MKRVLYYIGLLAAIVLCSMLFLSSSSYSEAADYELSVTWKLKYGILLKDGSIRGDRPEGYVSEMIDRQDETQLVLRNFQCSKAIQQLVCPVVFYDRKGSVVGYAEFVKKDGTSDYTVEIPKTCTKYQLSTEYINTAHPKAYCNRDQKSAATRLSAKRSQYDTAINSGVKSLQNQLKRRSVLYSMPVNTKADVKVELSSGQRLPDLLQKLEKQYRYKTVGVYIPGDYVVISTEKISVKNNRYVITSDGIVTGLKNVTGFQVKGDVVSFPRPSGLNSIESVLINGKEYVVCGDFSQEDPDLMPSFKDVKITEVSSSSGRYVYRIPMKDVSHFSKGSYVKIFSEWVCQMAEVVAVGKKSIDVMSHTAFGQTLMKSTYPVNLYCVRNNRKYLKAGTFWYDSSTVYCKLSSASEKVSSVAVPVASTLFTISGASNVIFSGVHFAYTAASDIFTYYQQGAMDCDGAVAVTSSSDIHFLDCEFDHIGDHCISIRKNSSRCSLQGNYFHDLGSGAVVVNNSMMPWQSGYVQDNTNSIFIYSNIVRGYGNLNAGSTGILVGFGNNVSVISNHVFDGFYTGISVGWGWNQYHLNRNTYVAGNVIHHIMKFLMCDGGGIYTLSNWDGGSVESNTIYCVNTRSRKDCAFGIYHDTGSSGILDYNNIIYACDLGNGSCEKGGVIQNNIYAYIGDYIIQVREGEGSLTSFVSGNIMNNLGGRVFSDSFGNLDSQTMTRVSSNVIYDMPQIPETFNAYGWVLMQSVFDNPKAGSFALSNASAVRNAVGYKVQRGTDYSGHQIPEFKSRYADKTTLSPEYISHFRALYNKLSVNRNNPYFN